MMVKAAGATAMGGPGAALLFTLHSRASQATLGPSQAAPSVRPGVLKMRAEPRFGVWERLLRRRPTRRPTQGSASFASSKLQTLIGPRRRTMSICHWWADAASLYLMNFSLGRARSCPLPRLQRFTQLHHQTIGPRSRLGRSRGLERFHHSSGCILARHGQFRAGLRPSKSSGGTRFLGGWRLRPTAQHGPVKSRPERRCSVPSF